MAFVGLGVILCPFDFFSILINDLIGNPPGLPLGSGAFSQFLSRLQGWIFFIYRRRKFHLFYLFRIQIPGNALFQNRKSVNRNRGLLVGIAGADSNGAFGRIDKAKIRLLPADGCILSGGYVVGLKGMGTSKGDFHTGLKNNFIEGAGNLADASAHFLNDCAAVVGCSRLISLFFCTLADDFIEGKLLSRLNNGAVKA